MVLFVPAAHRALVIRLAPRTLNSATRLSSSSFLSRVDHHYSRQRNLSPSCDCNVTPLSFRSYATAATGRPKAHTGRQPAKRTRTATKKPGPKTAAGKAKVGRKPTKAKAKSKPKAKPKAPKAPSKSALLREERSQRKTLRATALFEEPKKLPQTVWGLIFTESRPKGSSAADAAASTKAASDKLKHLTPEDREQYNHEAHANKAKNEAAYKRWVLQHTPEEIRQANNARKKLAREDQKKNDKKVKSSKFAPIKDDRQVKRPRSSYNIFHKERYQSGDFEKMALPEAAKLIGREWNALSSTAKKNYQDEAAADKTRYLQEQKALLSTST